MYQRWRCLRTTAGLSAVARERFLEGGSSEEPAAEPPPLPLASLLRSGLATSPVGTLVRLGRGSSTAAAAAGASSSDFFVFFFPPAAPPAAVLHGDAPTAHHDGCDQHPVVPHV